MYPDLSMLQISLRAFWLVASPTMDITSVSGDVRSASEGLVNSSASATSALRWPPAGSCSSGAELAGTTDSGMPSSDTSAGADTAARFCAAATAMAAAPVRRLGPEECLQVQV